VTYEVEMT